MATVSKQQLRQLFTRVDGLLTQEMNIYLIGGAAAILGYNVTKETNDVDIEGTIPLDFKTAFASEAKALKLDLRLSQVSVFSPPEGYRERAKFEDFPSRKLRIWYLDQYDLAISKIDRGIEKDFEDIERVHKQSPYERDQLIQIFNDEYIQTVAIGNPRTKKMNLIDLAIRLFGEEVAEDTAARIKL